MAGRKVKKKTDWESPAEYDPQDSLFEAITDKMREKFPGNIYTGDADAMRLVCLPVPAFSVRFLLQQEGWPLGRFVMLVGEEESCKSAFSYEIMRWHTRMPPGGGIYVPTEPKESTELLRSIVGYDNTNVRLHTRCRTTQDWNTALHGWIGNFRRYMDGAVKRDGTPKGDGVGRIAPVCFVVDSMMALVDASTHEKIEEDGASSRHFAINAALLDEWFKKVCPDIYGYPFSLVGINHLKPAKEKVGAFEKTVRNIGGGKTPKFMASLQIQMNRGKDVDRLREDERGIALDMVIYKNSNAPHERLRVEMLWYTDYQDRDPAGHFRQKTFFDWHTASTEMLLTLTKGEGKRAKRLSDVIEIHGDADTRRVYSPTLGVAQKNKVSYRELGEILEQRLIEDAEFRDAFYAETGVRRRYLFQQGVDFREQEERAVALARGLDNNDATEEFTEGTEAENGEGTA